MKIEQTSTEILLYILKCFLQNEEPCLSEETDMEQVRKLAGMHGLYGILCYMMLRWPNQFHSSQDGRMQHDFTGIISRMALRNAQMEETEQKFDKYSIDYIPVKGYVLKDLYPEPELRQYGDVDILIHASDRQACDKLLTNEGFMRCHDWEPVFSYRKGDLYLEVHTDLLDTDVSPRVKCREFFRKGAWEHASKKGLSRHEFSPEYHFLYLIAHIAKHISGSGAGIRMYLDLAMIMKHDEQMNWDYIMTSLKETGLMRLSTYLFMLAERFFDIKVPVYYELPDEDSFLDFLGYTMEGGVFGFENRDRGSVIMKQRSTGDADPASVILEKLFPSSELLKARYKYLQSCPWLLPAAWIHRFILTARDTSSHWQDAQAIMHADRQEIKHLKKIQEDLGL